MELIGALFVTIICAIAIIWLIGMPWLAMGFAGPSVGNWAWMIAGLSIATLVALGWWHFVGTKIHFGFG
ncbi:membrane protein [Streptomyces phage TunaTartare]|uniref:Membrane protein n=1 Tax=Streptomyces phage TunaTartare TaxID=2848887 RepID=A0A8F2E6S4_9CAUD|nr:membrane protein [Streptomyces phage TunaTartare]QWT30022.1 membrane protein [Streptomyces phage TunaTartare]